MYDKDEELNIEKESIDKDNLIVKLLIDMVKSQKKSMSKMIKLFIITIICYTIVMISGIVGFFWYESQFEIVETKTITTTTTQEVSGTDSEINNIQGDMYKDNAIHNKGGE